MECERTLRDVFQDKKFSLGELSAKANSHTLNNKHIQDIRSLPSCFNPFIHSFIHSFQIIIKEEIFVFS